MVVVGDVQRRNSLCLERARIQAHVIPECQNPEKLKQFEERLAEIEKEIELTYEGEQERSG